MSALLRKLADQRNGGLVGEAYFASLNLVATGLMSEERLAERLIARTTLAVEDARDAIERGLAAARRKPS